MTHHALRNNRIATADGCIVQVGPPPPEAALAALWRGSFFQSWNWTGCLYAERFPNPVLVQVTKAGEVKALALFNRSGTLFGAQRLLLGETGNAMDSLFIEHNAPLVARDTPEALGACLTGVLPGRLLVLSGISDAMLAAARAAGVIRCDITRHAPRVDLAAMRQSGKTILDLVSSNTRYQLRRSIRRYEVSGAIKIRRATSDTEAIGFLDALAALHTTTWRSRGLPGAFAAPSFLRFHQAMIGRGVGAGSVDVLEITAGSRLIGYLMNFVYRNQVYAYQSGFDYADAGPHEKPGLVCHHAAIMHYADRQMDVYDFLEGDDRYKASFADQTIPLHWIRMAGAFTPAGEMLRLRNLLDRLKEKSAARLA